MATYNNADFTRTTLDGYTRQSTKDFRIAIADDGSDEHIRSLIKEYKGKLNIRHVWHEDKGYRRALILNKAIASSTADYIIFVDNDCIPHKHFIQDHILQARPKQSVTGRRVNLGADISNLLINDISHVKSLENIFSLIRLVAQGKVRDGGRGARLPIFLSNMLNKKKRGLLGSNMAAWRSDLIDINGFDNTMVRYGGEETDLEWRLKGNGIHIQPLVNRAIQFHLYHEYRGIIDDDSNKNTEDKNRNIVTSHGIIDAEMELNRALNKN